MAISKNRVIINKNMTNKQEKMKYQDLTEQYNIKKNYQVKRVFFI